MKVSQLVEETCIRFVVDLSPDDALFFEVIEEALRELIADASVQFRRTISSCLDVPRIQKFGAP